MPIDKVSSIQCNSEYSQFYTKILLEFDAVYGAEQESAGNLPEDHDAEGDVMFDADVHNNPLLTFFEWLTAETIPFVK